MPNYLLIIPINNLCDIIQQKPYKQIIEKEIKKINNVFQNLSCSKEPLHDNEFWGSLGNFINKNLKNILIKIMKKEYKYKIINVELTKKQYKTIRSFLVMLMLCDFYPDIAINIDDNFMNNYRKDFDNKATFLNVIFANRNRFRGSIFYHKTKKW